MSMQDQNLTSVYTATVDAGGRAVITIQSQGNVPWLVSQVSAEMLNAPSGATCVMKKNGAFVTHVIATGDAVGGDPPLQLQPGDLLTIEWSNATPDDAGTALVFYDRLRYDR